jgi:hypothetical protein
MLKTMKNLVCLLIYVLIFGLVVNPTNASGVDSIKVKALLVWGTDTEVPNAPNLKPLPKDLSEKLKMFKWKYYFQVCDPDYPSKELLITKDKAETITLSKKCEIQVKYIGDSTIEVKLFGEKKLVLIKKQALQEGAHLVLAGEDKNDTAWFVIIGRLK